MRVQRYGAMAVAIVVSLWFVVGALQAHDIDAATTVLDKHAGISTSASQRTASLLSSAGFLYPGVEVALLRARLDMEQHDYAKAKPLVDRSVASEPDNLNAWVSALDLALVDPPAENTNEVTAHLRALDPIDIRAHTRR